MQYQCKRRSFEGAVRLYAEHLLAQIVQILRGSRLIMSLCTLGSLCIPEWALPPPPPMEATQYRGMLVVASDDDDCSSLAAIARGICGWCMAACFVCLYVSGWPMLEVLFSDHAGV